MNVTVDEVIDTLHACEDSVQVAELLRRAGVTGQRGVSWDCPVSCYVQRASDVDPDQVMTDRLAVRVGPGDYRDHTVALRAFVNQFDHSNAFGDLARSAPW